jgi:hypothetical protein
MNQPALKGHGFSRAAEAAKPTRALAPEGMLDHGGDLFGAYFAIAIEAIGISHSATF